MLEDVQRKGIDELLITGYTCRLCLGEADVTKQYIGLEHICLMPDSQSAAPQLCKVDRGTNDSLNTPPLLTLGRCPGLY